MNRVGENVDYTNVDYTNGVLNLASSKVSKKFQEAELFLIFTFVVGE